MPEFKLGTFTPSDAARVLDRRTNVPQPTFSWLDAWQAQHSRMFTVAKSTGFDILSDISDAVDGALKDGTTLDDFNRRLIPILKDKGWWGTAEAVDPLTGETRTVQLGSLRRLRIIYDTNLRMSYAAGRWAAVQRVKADRPYMRYMHTVSKNPRLEHLAWNGVTLPVDDPWWQTHYPPNGWGCKCQVVTLSERQFAAAQESGNVVTEAPPVALQPFVNRRTGERLMVPKGIDPGFGYNVGEAFLRALGGG